MYAIPPTPLARVHMCHPITDTMEPGPDHGLQSCPLFYQQILRHTILDIL